MKWAWLQRGGFSWQRDAQLTVRPAVLWPRVSPSVVFGLCSLAIILMVASCSRPIAGDSFVVTQISQGAAREQANDVLDRLYPSGSRVALYTGHPDSLRVLSKGLMAAGEPVVSFDAKRIVFAGKRSPEAQWQIYEATSWGGPPKALTAVPGGAMDPALLGDGSLIYVSPVASTTAGSSGNSLSALYLQRGNNAPRQLTFSSAPISDPTVLSDGRILFVSVQPSSIAGGPIGSALYTINNDGTEVTAFAGQHDKPTPMRRPRQLEERLVTVLTSDADKPCKGGLEVISMAQPFGGRRAMFPGLAARVYSVDQSLEGNFLVCADAEGRSGQIIGLGGVFLLNRDAKALGTPVLFDPNRSAVEAVAVVISHRPMGRLSNVEPSRKTGQILCLDANNTTYGARPDQGTTRATKVRVFTKKGTATTVDLGLVDLQADGSFMAEVPADMPLGFEALDKTGSVLRRVEPLIWVRPGENRSCIGCHEPHNHSPRNYRPLAVRAPVPRLNTPAAELAQKSPWP